MKRLLYVIAIAALIVASGPAVKAQHGDGHSGYSTHHYVPHGYYGGYGSGGHGYTGYGYRGPGYHSPGYSSPGYRGPRYSDHSGGHYGHRQTYRPLFGLLFGY